MSKSNVNLEKLDLEELQAISENAQQLIEEKKHQRLYDAFSQFEKIAKECDCSISEILEAGKRLQKKRSIRYVNPNNPKENWTGRGRKPKWLEEAIKKGKKVEDFLVS